MFKQRFIVVVGWGGALFSLWINLLDIFLINPIIDRFVKQWEMPSRLSRADKCLTNSLNLKLLRFTVIYQSVIKTVAD